MLLKFLSEDSQVIQVKAEGKITQEISAQGNEPLAQMFGVGIYSRRVLLNLEEAQFMDSSGVGWLLDCHKRFREHGGKLVLHSPPSIVLNVFRVLHLESYFFLAENSSEARLRAVEEST